MKRTTPNKTQNWETNRVVFSNATNDVKSDVLKVKKTTDD